MIEIWSIVERIHKKNLEKPYKMLLEILKKKEWEERKVRIYSVTKDPSVKVQRPNIEGHASFEKNRKWKGKKERKDKGSISL
jgi:hypothetical protein